LRKKTPTAKEEYLRFFGGDGKDEAGRKFISVIAWEGGERKGGGVKRKSISNVSQMVGNRGKS